MRAGAIVNGRYIGVANGGILHTSNYIAGAMGATMYGPRVTQNLLGDGYVEAVSDDELERISHQQQTASQGKVHGEVVYLTQLAASSGDAKVVGRFGWKAQHASILDASADALLEELGIPNRIFKGVSQKSDLTGSGRKGTSDAARDELDARWSISFAVPKLSCQIRHAVRHQERRTDQRFLTGSDVPCAMFDRSRPRPQEHGSKVLVLW